MFQKGERTAASSVKLGGGGKKGKKKKKKNWGGKREIVERGRPASLITKEGGDSHHDRSRLGGKGKERRLNRRRGGKV